MLNKMLPDVARQTADIDFSIQSSDIYADLIKTMDKLGQYFISKGYIARHEIKPEIHQHRSGGMKMCNAKGENILGIDIGWHDLTFGTTVFNINNYDVHAFSAERMLSDKFSATLSRRRFRRAKDLYDIFIMTDAFDVDLSTVFEWIKDRTKDEGSLDNFPFDGSTVQKLARAYNSFTVKNYLGNQLEKPPFSEVYNRFCMLMNEMLSDNIRCWNHVDGSFK